MTDSAIPVAPEFSRPIDVARLPQGEAVYDIAATPAERATLASRFGLLALHRLEAQVRLHRLAGGLLRLSAELSADVVQSCVVTLDPVGARVDDSFALLYGAPDEEGAKEVVLSGEAELVEPLPDGLLDIGEVVAQQLSLALDPYPRAAGAVAEAPQEGLASPFAALAKWRETR